MEYCHCGSLAAFLGRGSRLNEDELRDISACSLLGLNYLHNLKVIHRSEEKLNEKIDQLVEEALASTEVIEIQ